jgi:hypothetical protein
VLGTTLSVGRIGCGLESGVATTAVFVYVVPGKPLVVAVTVLPGIREDALVDVVGGGEVGV